MSADLQKELGRYITGFITALVLSILAYQLTISGWIANGVWLAGILLALAAAQMLVQVAFFLHLRSEQKPRWQTYSYIFTWAMLLIIVVGSIWIMRNLDYNMHISPDRVNDYMLEQAQKGF